MKFKVGDKAKSKRFEKGKVLYVEKEFLSEYPIDVSFKCSIKRYTKSGKLFAKDFLQYHQPYIKQDKIKKVKK